MKRILRNLRPLAPIIDVFLSWLTFISIIWFRIIKFWGPRYTPFSKWLFFKMGMIPVVKHYYEPFPDLEKIEESYKYPRNLISLDFNVESQLKFLNSFDFSSELSKIPFEISNGYYFNNDSFGMGDAEAYYSIIRLLKPKNIIEIGGGDVGVFVHFHDIFSPNYYPKKWLLAEMRLWNEQFLLEGFLSYNRQFKIVLSMSYLINSHRNKLIAFFPNLGKYPYTNPSSFRIRKV